MKNIYIKPKVFIELFLSLHVYLKLYQTSKFQTWNKNVSDYTRPELDQTWLTNPYYA